MATKHSKCGLTYLEKYAMDRHASSSTKGQSFPFTTVDCLADGFVESFQGKYFYDTTAFGTPVRASLSTSLTYLLQNCNQPFAILTDATGVSATTGIVAAVAGDTRGSLKLEVTDAASNGVGFYQQDSLWITPSAREVIVDFEFSNIANHTLGGARALAQLGIMVAKGANFLVINNLSAALTNAPSADFIMVEISQTSCRLVTKASASATAVTYSRWFELPAGSHTLSIEIIQGLNVYLWIDGYKQEASLISRTSAIAASQVFGRVGHTAAYVTLTDTPITIEIDSIACSVPRIDY